MAAAGGDTVVPTNWGGLIVITVIVAVVAAVTYFGMEFQFGHQGGEDKSSEKSLSVQDVFSASARREVAAAGSARVLSRADLAASDNSSMNADASNDADGDGEGGMDSDSKTGSSADWDNTGSNTSGAAKDDWGSAASSDDWDTTTDDWDSSAETSGSASSSSKTDDWDAEVSDTMQSAADKTASMAAEVGAASKQAAQDAAAAARETASNAADKVKTAAQQTKQEFVAAASAAASKISAATDVPQRPSPDALRDWWSDANGDLAIRFAGTLDRGAKKMSDGIAVMFSDAVSPAQGQQHIHVKDGNGKAVAGQWKTSRNPNMLILDGLKPGRYELSIDSAISSQNGKSLNSTANGPVFVY